MTRPTLPPATYRGRLAPSPTGHLHLGHARTFWMAGLRARQHRGVLVLRNEDLDPQRSRPEFVEAFMEDLRWLGLVWDEGPDCGGQHGPYNQSERLPLYREAFEQLRRSGAIYPCRCSRRDVQRALTAPHAIDDEPIYPGTCRPGSPGQAFQLEPRARVSWRFRVPDGEGIAFEDRRVGSCRFVAGVDFGDFVVWRPDDLPSYQLAVVVDDGAMRISEVVRGEDLLLSTARQILLYRALQLAVPDFFHCPLMVDEMGRRLAKRHAGLSLRSLRESGVQPDQLVRSWSSVDETRARGCESGTSTA